MHTAVVVHIAVAEEPSRSTLPIYLTTHSSTSEPWLIPQTPNYSSHWSVKTDRSWQHPSCNNLALPSWLPVRAWQPDDQLKGAIRAHRLEMDFRTCFAYGCKCRSELKLTNHLPQARQSKRQEKLVAKSSAKLWSESLYLSFTRPYEVPWV